MKKLSNTPQPLKIRVDVASTKSGKAQVFNWHLLSGTKTVASGTSTGSESKAYAAARAAEVSLRGSDISSPPKIKIKTIKRTKKPDTDW
jgi:hypothetical protein